MFIISCKKFCEFPMLRDKVTSMHNENYLSKVFIRTVNNDLSANSYLELR
jgi:hypothetical protein